MSGAIAGQSFAGLISGARRAKNWSQEDLERESGVSRSTLSRWERGEAGRPEPEHVRAVCAALDVDPRHAMVALGYLTADEIEPNRPLPREIAEIAEIIENRDVPAAELRNWIEYLHYLKEKARSRARQ